MLVHVYASDGQLTLAAHCVYLEIWDYKKLIVMQNEEFNRLKLELFKVD